MPIFRCQPPSFRGPTHLLQLSLTPQVFKKSTARSHPSVCVAKSLLSVYLGVGVRRANDFRRRPQQPRPPDQDIQPHDLGDRASRAGNEGCGRRDNEGEFLLRLMPTPQAIKVDAFQLLNTTLPRKLPSLRNCQGLYYFPIGQMTVFLGGPTILFPSSLSTGCRFWVKRRQRPLLEVLFHFMEGTASY